MLIEQSFLNLLNLMTQPFVNYLFYDKHSLFLFGDCRKLRNDNMTVIRDEESEISGEVLDEYYDS